MWHANTGVKSLMINLSMRIVNDLPVTCEPFFRTGTDKKVFMCYAIFFTSSTDPYLFGYGTHTSCLRFQAIFMRKYFTVDFLHDF